MSKDEKEIENPDEIVNLVEKIPESNEIYQEGQRLKILTLNQILNRLPISLV